jgi:hypothetical protein
MNATGGSSPPPTPDEAHARRLLAEVYTPDGVDLWLTRPNRRLDGATPLDLIEHGDGLRVLMEIEGLIEGVFV